MPLRTFYYLVLAPYPLSSFPSILLPPGLLLLLSSFLPPTPTLTAWHSQRALQLTHPLFLPFQRWWQPSPLFWVLTCLAESLLHFDRLALKAWALLGIRGRAGSGLKAICTNTILFYVLLTILFSRRLLLSSPLGFIYKDLTVSSDYRWKYPGDLKSSVRSRESSAPDWPFAGCVQ